MMHSCREMLDWMEKTYRQAAAAGQLRKGVDPRLAALESYAFLSGLFRLWLIDRRSQVVRKQTRKLLAAHIATRRPC
jgi:TetR/AcrR family transcriptional regulator, acrAB operon repressor